MAQPGAVVYVVIANDSALKLLSEIDLLVENFAAREHSHPAPAIFFDDLFQFSGGSTDGLIPGSFHQLAPLADKRVFEPFFVGNKFMDGKTFDAKVLVVQCLVSAGSAALDRPPPTMTHRNYRKMPLYFLSAQFAGWANYLPHISQE